MCGIAGYIDFSNSRCGADMHAVVGAMGDSMAHRGPDDRGTWADPDAGIAFGHRRLSIIDLSPAGHQPMLSGSGRFVIVFNGEAYNYLDILQELKQVAGGEIRLRGHSDTEVILMAFDHWGVEETLPRMQGMFAMGIWDRDQRALWLVRDRFGKKPLYYGRFGNTILFASELKAIRVHPAFQAELDPDALTSYLRFNWIPAPQSIYRGVRKLAAGSWLRISPDGAEQGPRSYWSLGDLARTSLASPFQGSAEEATQELDRLLRSAVRSRMLASDVPVGLFLSGGVDSSTVTALAQAQSSVPIHTFSIGMSSSAYDESKFARAVAQHLATDHTELQLTPPEAMGVIPELPSIYDEPFADASAVPTLLVSRLARRHVVVALSGDGGDEMFAGYNRHIMAAILWPKMAKMSRRVRRQLAKVLGWVAPEKWENFVRGAGAVVPRPFQFANLSDKMHKIQRGAAAIDSQDLYLQLLSSWQNPVDVLNFDDMTLSIPAGAKDWLSNQRAAESMMLADACVYMPDDILVKVDRASMAASLEVRNPFLDLGVAEFAWRLPLRFKVRDGAGKWIVRRVMDQYIPRELTVRPKMGFALPLAEWLRGPLRDWAESLIHASPPFEECMLKGQVVQSLWEAFLAGRTELTDRVWCLLILKGWLESQKTLSTSAPGLRLAATAAHRFEYPS